MTEQTQISRDFLARAVLVNGMAKSGTTLIASLLDAHPQLLMLPKEVPLLASHENAQKQQSTKTSAQNNLQEITSRLVRYLENKFAGIDEISDPDKRLDSLLRAFTMRAGKVERLERVYEELVVSVAEVYELDLADKVAWGLKNTENSEIQAFLDTFPKGRLIHISRDPRGFFLSRFQSHKRKNRRVFGLKPRLDSFFYIWAVMRRWSELEAKTKTTQQRAGIERVHILSYEDLVSNPVSEMVKVFDFLRLESIEPQLIRPSRLGKTTQTDTAKMSEKADTAVYDTSARKWEHELSPYTLFLVEALTADDIKQSAYSKLLLVPAGALFGLLAPFFSVCVKLYARIYAKKTVHMEKYDCENGHRFSLSRVDGEPSANKCIYCNGAASQVSSPHQI